MSKRSQSDEVTITKDDLEATVKRESVAAYERNGWTVADDGSSEEPQNDAEPTQADEGQEV